MQTLIGLYCHICARIDAPWVQSIAVPNLCHTRFGRLIPSLLERLFYFKVTHIIISTALDTVY